jgi:hypothetical protein
VRVDGGRLDVLRLGGGGGGAAFWRVEEKGARWDGEGVGVGVVLVFDGMWTVADGLRGLGGGGRFEGESGRGSGILSWFVGCGDSVETLRREEGFEGRLGGIVRFAACSSSFNCLSSSLYEAFSSFVNGSGSSLKSIKSGPSYCVLVCLGRLGKAGRSSGASVVTVPFELVVLEFLDETLESGMLLDGVWSKNFFFCGVVTSLMKTARILPGFSITTSV